MMNYKSIALAVCILGSGLPIVNGQESTMDGVFTLAQAEAGRTAFEDTCGKCHTSSLVGRTGKGGELPPVSSLSGPYQEFIGTRGFVSPLAGKVFLERWGGKTAGELVARFAETVEQFPPAGMDKETAVNITAYVLQVNGARAGTRALTRSTQVRVNSITR